MTEKIRFFKDADLSKVEEQFNEFSKTENIEKVIDLKFLNGEYILGATYFERVKPVKPLDHDVLIGDLYDQGKITARLSNVLYRLRAKTINDASRITLRELKKTVNCGAATAKEFERLMAEYGFEAEY